MPRATASDRLPELIRTAGNVFLAKGYRRAQMADIAAALGLSAGAVYRYVESKEALFDLVVRYEADREGYRPPDQLPVPTPAPNATLDFLSELLHREAGLPVLQKALATEAPSSASEEVAAIGREIFRAIASRQRGLKILERSALDWPELSEIWWGSARLSLVEVLTAYIQQRTTAGLFRPLPDAAAASRIFTETAAYFALHRHYDPEPTEMTIEVAEATLVAVLVRTFTKD